MCSSTHTDRNWNFLTHYGEYDWSDDWRERRDDRQYWDPAIEQIARQHGLAMTHEPEIGAGSNLAYLLDDTVVNIFARYNPIRYPREVEALQRLALVPDARTPRLIAEGIMDVDGAPCHYIVLERLPGRLLRWTWDEMAQDERVDVIRQLAPVVRAIHAAPIYSLLHGFPLMRWGHEEHSHIRSLTELIDTMNGLGVQA